MRRFRYALSTFALIALALALDGCGLQPSASPSAALQQVSGASPDGGFDCIDGDACDTGDPCLPGICNAGDCVPSAPLPDDTPCDDFDPCTDNDKCTGGVCAGTPAPDSDGTCEGLPDGVSDWLATFGPSAPDSVLSSRVPVGGGGVAAAIAPMAGLCPQVLPPADGAVFQNARGPRWIPNPRNVLRNPNPNRRSSFLYPQDGCFARADAMAYNVSNMALVGKIFVFGALTVATGNAPAGRVRWRYHVADCYRDAMNTVWVIDPSLSPNATITAANWVALQIAPAAANVVICQTGAYTPMSPCNAAPPAPLRAWYNRFIVDQSLYLNAEWNNIVGLRRNPQLELTTTPMGWLPAGGLP